MPSFRKSIGYIRMLAELDILKDISKSDDEDMRSLDDQNSNETLTSLLIDVDDKEKRRDTYTCIATCTSDESSATDCTLSASICQKGNVNNKYFLFY